MSEHVTVKALQAHTHQGKDYAEGDRYDVAPEFVDTLIVQGKATLVDQPAAAPPKARVSKPVEPMSTGNTPLAPPKG